MEKRNPCPPPYGIPSHDTFRRVFIQLDPQQLLKAFLEWIEGVREKLGATLVAIDGKTVRGSHDGRHSKSALHLVSAWAVEHSLVLGQVATEEKSNEIVAIPQLLDLLDLKGCIVSIDAIGCQAAIAAKIVEKKGEYVLAVKDNQKTLHEQLKWFFSDIELPADLRDGLVARHESFDSGLHLTIREPPLSSGVSSGAARPHGFPSSAAVPTCAESAIAHHGCPRWRRTADGPEPGRAPCSRTGRSTRRPDPR